MRDGAAPAAIIVAALAMICCAAPLLIAAVGTAALMGWLADSVYVLIPAAIIGLGLAGLWYYRRSLTPQDCCHPISINKAPNHE